jgi:hypothetical protein
MSEPTLRDKIDLLILEQERHLKKALDERENENLTQGETRALHVEIAQRTFCLKTLKFLKYD